MYCMFLTKILLYVAETHLPLVIRINHSGQKSKPSSVCGYSSMWSPKWLGGSPRPIHLKHGHAHAPWEKHSFLKTRTFKIT